MFFVTARTNGSEMSWPCQKLSCTLSFSLFFFFLVLPNPTQAQLSLSLNFHPLYKHHRPTVSLGFSLSLSSLIFIRALTFLPSAWLRCFSSCQAKSNTTYSYTYGLLDSINLVSFSQYHHQGYIFVTLLFPLVIFGIAEGGVEGLDHDRWENKAESHWSCRWYLRYLPLPPLSSKLCEFQYPNSCHELVSLKVWLFSIDEQELIRSRRIWRTRS